MFSELAFFSFIELTDASQHRRYNEWHQLDHRPENLALPGVAWGDRWARPAEFKAAGAASPEFANVDYTAMYWFRSPLPDSIRAWDRLGEDSFQWGRGPLIPGVERRMLAFFKPVKGYIAPRALVSADVLPFRPNRGLHLTLSRFSEPHSLGTHAQFQWEDQTLIPRLLTVPGVAGAWTFSFSHAQRHATLPLEGSGSDAPGSLRIRLLYVDEDPLEASANISDSTARLVHEGLGSPSELGEQVLLSTPVKTIVPWQDW